MQLNSYILFLFPLALRGSTNLLETREKEIISQQLVFIIHSHLFPASSFRRILLLKNVLGENRRRLGFLGVGMRGCFVELNST